MSVPFVCPIFSSCSMVNYLFSGLGHQMPKFGATNKNNSIIYWKKEQNNTGWGGKCDKNDEPKDKRNSWSLWSTKISLKWPNGSVNLKQKKEYPTSRHSHLHYEQSRQIDLFGIRLIRLILCSMFNESVNVISFFLQFSLGFFGVCCSRQWLKLSVCPRERQRKEQTKKSKTKGDHDLLPHSFNVALFFFLFDSVIAVWNKSIRVWCKI